MCPPLWYFFSFGNCVYILISNEDPSSFPLVSSEDSLTIVSRLYRNCSPKYVPQVNYNKKPGMYHRISGKDIYYRKCYFTNYTDKLICVFFVN